MMKLNVFKISKWISAWVSVISMVIAPVAMGKETENITMQMAQTVYDNLGLHKSMTVGEFYQKNKDLFPLRIQKEVEPVFTKFKNQKMPQVELVGTKGTDGLVVPTLRISDGSQLINLQLFGEDNKWAKLQNTQLTKIDMINFNDIVVRVLAGDESFRKQTDPLKKTSSMKAPNRQFNFAAYPDATARDWATMSDKDKAAYIVNLRMLWLDARRVLIEKNKLNPNEKKTSQNLFEKNEKFFEMLFGQPAEARSVPASEGREESIVKAKTTKATDKKVFTGNSCIVAGYVAKYENGQYCSHKLIDQHYDKVDLSLYRDAKKFCNNDGGKIACNPYVFGTPNGSPTCVLPGKTDDFQRGTLIDGPCERVSRLGEAQGSDANKKQTEDYLLGVLKFRGTIDEKAKSLMDHGVLNNSVLDQIRIDKKIFDQEIETAKKSCAAESKNTKHEPNYWNACDSLNKRFLSVEAFFASKCTGGNLNPATLKCTCMPAGKIEVLPGASCAPVSVTPIPEPQPPVVRPPVTDVGSKCKDTNYGDLIGLLDGNCKCKDGSPPKISADNGAQKQFTCDKPDDKEKQPKDDDCGFFCSFTKKLPTIALGIGLATLFYYGVTKLFSIKKPAISSPGDGCTTGQAPPCTPVCKAPYAKQTDGTCNGCAACAAGQSATLANGCNCTSAPANTTVYVCPDGITSKPDISQCPYYACNTTNPPTTYQNPSNCPSTSNSPPATGTPGKTR